MGSELIKNSLFNHFHLYEKNDGVDYRAILQAFIAGELTGHKLTSGHALRDVFLLQHNGRKYILKWDREVDPRLEKKIWQFISGPYNSGLMKRVTQAKQQGCSIVADIYLVAEKTACRQSVESYILLEYIDGQPLEEIDDITAYHEEIAECIQQLHRYGLASNDPHPGNFIITDQGLRIIDLSDRGALAICQANDALALQRLYGIDLPQKHPIYSLIACKEKLKKLSRRLRGKSPK